YWYLWDAFADWNTGNDHAAIDHLLEAGFTFFTAIGKLVSKDTNYDPPYLNPYLWENCTNGVTWKAIVEAWIKNDFEGRVPTIAVIDRMRQILWDEPFSVQWAARPETKIE
ncbi:unnamed protein product, partial [marine sediment metagenome]